MALPALDTFCVSNQLGSNLCFTFPGGAQVCGIPQNLSADGTERVNALLAQANSALAPLMPIFNIIDCVVAVINCLKAVQKAIASVPPQPQKIAECFPKLASALAKLLQLVPQLSIPVMVGQLLDILIAYLTAIRTELMTIILKLLRIAEAQSQAAALGSAQLMVVTNCAQKQVDDYIANMNANAKPIGELVQLINLFLELAGADPIPSPFTLDPNANNALSGIDDAIAVLQTIRATFP